MPRGKKLRINDDMSWMDRVVLFLGEVGGTAVLMFLGCMGCVGAITSNGVISDEQMSWAFGFAVLIAIQIFGHISGAHISPVVTLAAFVLGNVSLMQLPIYFLGQLFGALTGFGLLMVVTPSNYIKNRTSTAKVPGVCSPAINPKISRFQAFLVEFIITAILSWVCCAIWDPRNSNKLDSLTIRFGFTIAVLAMTAGPYTGAHMNPARSLAPALFNGDWDDH
ncbi:aquaporin AQPcic-like [Sitophilus oryzae]|uniref:Aquaporin AQPcic-like n=1 Tax=Sitophilus oryzae TaxID=7048 RepID=A0A6J2XI88_SITOR|nr:aquaporin AQPcic-like [Sitophilus oryzae]